MDDLLGCMAALTGIFIIVFLSSLVKVTLYFIIALLTKTQKYLIRHTIIDMTLVLHNHSFLSIHNYLNNPFSFTISSNSFRNTDITT